MLVLVNMSNLLVSIIIPTYNEEKDIGKCIVSLKKQSYSPKEIIIVDDGSNDKTLEIIKKFQDIKIFKQEHGGPALARNFGAKNSKGKILIFVDADMTFNRDYLKYLIEPIIDDKKKEIIGTEEKLQIADNLENIWSRCQGKLMSDPNDKDRRIFRAIRKDKFIEMGGFDSKYGYSDDQTFFFKYKIRPYVVDGAICYHKNPETLNGVYKQSRWIGASHSYFWLKIPILNLISILLMLFLFPLFVVVFSIKKSYKNKDFSIFLYMLIFITVKYFGTIAGYLRKVLWKRNYR
jgi:glycosyltransferase involved in cell wall biosynthesis